MTRDELDIPDFLRISQAERRKAWEKNPPKAMPAFGREEREVERLYRLSKERDAIFAKSTTDYVERKEAFLSKRAAEQQEAKRIRTEAAATAKASRKTFAER
jgi:hypothetical protein